MTNWKEEISLLHGDQGYSMYPFLWAKTDVSIAERSRRAVPMIELWNLGQDLAQKLNQLPDGVPIKLHFL